MSVARSKAKIQSLVSRGVRTNLRKASTFTVQAVANATFRRQQPHPQRKAAINELGRRSGTGRIYRSGYALGGRRRRG